MKEYQMKFVIKDNSIKLANKKESIEVLSANDISLFIKKYRKEKKITQEDLAKYSNVSRIAISEFENGKTDIRLSTLLKILKVCSLSLKIKER